MDIANDIGIGWVMTKDIAIGCYMANAIGIGWIWQMTLK